MDGVGEATTFVTAEWGGVMKTTRIISNTNSPIFNKVLE